MAEKLSPEPDLPEARNQQEIEKHIKQMLGPAPQEPVPTGLSEPSEDTAAEEANQPSDGVASETESSPAAEDIPEDIVTSEAVDDIVAAESDEVIAAEDAELAKAFTPEKSGIKAKLRKLFQRWWGNKIARWSTIIGGAAAILAAAIVPASRYFLLNSVGVRGSASITIVDQTSQQPLKNVRISLSNGSELTDSDGRAILKHLRLGKSRLKIEKSAYARNETSMVVGWGSNPLGTISVKAVGAQYTIFVKDYLSGLPIEKAEASSGEADAVSDQDGKIVLAIAAGSDPAAEVTISAESYRDEKLTLNLDNKAEPSVTMTPARKAVFISKRSGKLDVYKIDIDGQNEEIVLPGSGLEQNNLALLAHPTDEVTALVSTRDNVRNSDGFLLSTLTIIDLSDNSTKTAAQSERLQLLGWIDGRLFFLQIAAGSSGNNPKRYRLMSYDYKTGGKKELASSNYFNDVSVIAGNLYYAPAAALQNDSQLGFFKVSAEGTGKQTIINRETWAAYRTGYDILTLSVGSSDWYEYRLGAPSATKLSGQPSSPTYRLYVDSPDKKHSLWVDQRDGKGVLLAYDAAAKSDKILKTQSGITGPVRWLSNNALVYRITTEQETADYALNIDGGEPKKIKDVTDTIDVREVYYY